MVTFGPVYPNPARDQVTIPFTLPSTDSFYLVSIIVYDVLGNEINTILNQEINGGFHQVLWPREDKSGSNVLQGVYIVKMNVYLNGMKNQLNGKILLK